MIVKNIRYLIKNETGLFTVMLITVFSSALLLYFSYGLYQNFSVRLTDAQSEYKELTLEVNEGKELTKAELISFIKALKANTADNVDIFLAAANAGSISSHRSVTDEVNEQIEKEYGGSIMTDETGIEVRFSADTDITLWEGAVFYFRFRCSGGQLRYIDLSDNAASNGRMLTSGRLYTDHEYDSGARVVVGKTSPEQSVSKYLYDGGKAWLWNEEYEVIGTADSCSLPTPPITAAPDELVLKPYLDMYFHTALTSAQYKDIRQTAEQVIPGIFRFEDMSFPDSESRYVYKNIILISIFIALMSGINFVMLYRSILERRSRTLAVLRICGCSRARAVLYYICECAAISLPTFSAGLLVYIPVMKYRLSNIFVYMEDAYSVKVYIGIFMIYFLLMLVILTIMISINTRKSICDIIKGRR